MKCPEFQEILDLVEDKLKPEARKKVEKHISGGCHQCREVRDWASKTIQLMNQDQLVDAPEYAVQKAISLFQGKKNSVLDWVRGKLDFDSWAMPAMAGVRSEDRGPRQMVYITGHYKVVLLLPYARENSMLTGQLIGTDSEAIAKGCLVQVAIKRKIIDSSLTNASGEFVLSSVPDKKAELLIYGEPESIRIPL